MMVVQVEELIKRFNGKLALDCFNLEVEKGEVIGLLGPNGAGKTTSIRSIIGLIPFDDGRNKDIKRRIGYVTQELTIYEDMSARENLAFFGSLYGLSGEQLQARI
jgi:ABC-2 type transport system ATP-binding protein